MSEPTLILHVAIPGVYAEDLAETATEFYDGDVGELVLEELMRSEVGITIVTLPGEKAMSHEFGIHAYTATIVGAEVRER